MTTTGAIASNHWMKKTAQNMTSWIRPLKRPMIGPLANSPTVVGSVFRELAGQFRAIQDFGRESSSSL